MTSIRTLCDIFYHSVETFRKPDHLLHKKDGAWTPISSDAFLTAVEELSMGLRSLGLEKGDRVAILSENRPEWAYADLATLCAGAVDAPIYATLTAPQVLYILNDSGAKVVFVSTAAQLQKVQEVRAQAPMLRHVIRMEDAAAARHLLPRRRAGARPRGPRHRPGRGQEARRQRRASGPRHHHLHLGHHRRSQGRDAHPRQHRLERLRVLEALRGYRQQGHRPLLPPPVPRLRAHGRPLPDAAPRGHHRLRRERRQGPRQPGSR